MRSMSWVVVVVGVAGMAYGQTPGAEVQRLFEAGQHEQVAAAGAEGADPAAVYLAGLSLVELDRADEAVARFQQLAQRPEGDAWRGIGLSAAALNRPGAQDDPAATAEAEAAARAAIAANPMVPYGHYQLGLVQGRKRDYTAAAAAFEAAITVEPRFAYAHYYAGLSHYQVQRTDLMAIAFEAFLKLAPEAPERPQVESIMRTLRGRR